MERVARPKLKQATLKDNGERGSGRRTARTGTSTPPLFLCTRGPSGSPRLRSHRKAWLWLQTLQRRQEGPVCPARGSRPERSGCRPHRHLPLAPPPPRTPENSPSLQAQDVQEGETDSEGRRDRGYLLGRNHLCNMPYFKPDHGSRLSGCPEQGARRGQSSARRAHTRAHTGPRSAPSFPRGAPTVDRERCIPLHTLSCPHPRSSRVGSASLWPESWASSSRPLTLGRRARVSRRQEGQTRPHPKRIPAHWTA